MFFYTTNQLGGLMNEIKMRAEMTEVILGMEFSLQYSILGMIEDGREIQG